MPTQPLTAIVVASIARAAALQMRCKGGSDCPALASLDADLQRVGGAWDGLPTHIRKTILALVAFAEPPANNNVLPNGAAESTPARRSSC